MKIALCFLTYSNFSRADAWKDYESDENFTIYIHNKFPFTDYLSKYCIKRIIDTRWGDISLVKATLSLFHTAFQENDNKFFILLCGSSVPLFKPKELYSFIISKNTNILYRSPNDSQDHNDISTSACRFETLSDKNFFSRPYFIKQDQWMTLDRNTVSFFINNNFLSVFGDDFFIPDEHYFINLMCKFNIPFINKAMMHVEWKDVCKKGKRFKMPVTHKEVDENTIKKARNEGCFFLRKIANS